MVHVYPPPIAVLMVFGTQVIWGNSKPVGTSSLVCSETSSNSSSPLPTATSGGNKRQLATDQLAPPRLTQTHPSSTALGDSVLTWSTKLESSGPAHADFNRCQPDFSRSRLLSDHPGPGPEVTADCNRAQSFIHFARAALTHFPPIPPVPMSCQFPLGIVSSTLTVALLLPHVSNLQLISNFFLVDL
ncbi:hypothetical protein C8R46DRAFT_1194132 [Mycena filopes]|nr:hypothetical protein C8R46DRAFT_1194132 [Mycena filopes]